MLLHTSDLFFHTEVILSHLYHQLYPISALYTFYALYIIKLVEKLVEIISTSK